MSTYFIKPSQKWVSRKCFLINKKSSNKFEIHLCKNEDFIVQSTFNDLKILCCHLQQNDKPDCTLRAFFRYATNDYFINNIHSDGQKKKCITPSHMCFLNQTLVVFNKKIKQQKSIKNRISFYPIWIFPLFKLHIQNSFHFFFNKKCNFSMM